MHMLKDHLKARGIKVEQQQLVKFFKHVKDICPWFPEEGSINMEVWDRVGRCLKEYYLREGKKVVPAEISSFWSLIRETLNPKSMLTEEEENFKKPEELPEKGGRYNSFSYL